MLRLTLAVALFSTFAIAAPASDPPIKELGRDGYAEGVIYNVDVKGGYFDLRTADGPVRARSHGVIVLKKEWGVVPMTMEDVAALNGSRVGVRVLTLENVVEVFERGTD